MQSIQILQKLSQFAELFNPQHNESMEDIYSVCEHSQCDKKMTTLSDKENVEKLHQLAYFMEQIQKNKYVVYSDTPWFIKDIATLCNIPDDIQKSFESLTIQEEKKEEAQKVFILNLQSVLSQIEYQQLLEDLKKIYSSSYLFCFIQSRAIWNAKYGMWKWDPKSLRLEYDSRYQGKEYVFSNEDWDLLTTTCVYDYTHNIQQDSEDSSLVIDCQLLGHIYFLPLEV